ncbi:LysR substrate-binding domain-containing protein, partial [Rothia nasimurium]|uniref:LysR substrate-binding domain-containing protein n=1 Tax=Rothia nasimurium TaxID=85336 RepID=UPI0034DDF2C7
DHPMANQLLNLDNFCALDFAMMSYDGGQFYGVCDEALAKLGKTRRVSVSVNHFSLLPNILRTTDVVALIPSRLSHHLTGLICKTLPLEVQGFSLQMAGHERTHQDPAYQWIRNLLVESFTKQ